MLCNEASQGRMKLMMGAWWPWHARQRNEPRPNDAHDACLLPMARAAPKQAKAKWYAASQSQMMLVMRACWRFEQQGA